MRHLYSFIPLQPVPKSHRKKSIQLINLSTCNSPKRPTLRQQQKTTDASSKQWHHLKSSQKLPTILNETVSSRINRNTPKWTFRQTCQCKYRAMCPICPSQNQSPPVAPSTKQCDPKQIWHINFVAGHLAGCRLFCRSETHPPSGVRNPLNRRPLTTPKI